MYSMAMQSCLGAYGVAKSERMILGLPEIKACACLASVSNYSFRVVLVSGRREPLASNPSLSARPYRPALRLRASLPWPWPFWPHPCEPARDRP
jgi:hypothetical protein